MSHRGSIVTDRHVERSGTRKTVGTGRRGVALVAAALLVAVLGVTPAVAGLAEPIQIDGGAVTGTPSWGRGVRMFRGVPFAAPPVDELRWRPPQPVVPWQGVRAAADFGPSCMQRQRSPFAAPYNDGTHGYSEDCLYLNVWTPAAAPSDRLPVMVWIYGGGGVEGSGSEALYDPNGLAKKGVVVVSFNYRVNVFGWMAHPELTAESEHHASGNYGALDQVAALGWVKRNIAGFGGDPGRVTIFGESGGSRSVNWLMASPLAKGLFQRAIAESHTVFDRMATLAEAEAQGQVFARSAGAGSLAALRAMPAADVERAVLEKGPRMGAAIVDGWFLPEDVHTLFAAGKQNDVPLITGATNDEGGAIAGAARTNIHPTDLASYHAWAQAALGDDASTLLRLYPAATDVQARAAFHDISRDANYAGHRTWAQLQSKTGRSPVYLYLWSLAPPAWSADGTTADRSRGAYHGSEILYVFDNLRFADAPWAEVDRRLADLASSYWVSFAASGDPNGPGRPQWPIYDPAAERLLDFDHVVHSGELDWPGLDFLAARVEAERGAAR